MFPIDVLRFSEFRTMRNHLSETLMLNDIQITSDYRSRWVVLKRRVGAVTSQRVVKVLFYVNILQCFFVVENFTANAVSVAIGDNGNRLIFEPKPFGTEEFARFRQEFGLHRFKLHRHLVDMTVKSVWIRQVFSLLRVRFVQVSLYLR